MRKLFSSLVVLVPCIILLIQNTYGKGYWQQFAHYKIAVTLNTDEHTAIGHETITYKNNSPDTLNFVWFHLYPNAYKDDNSLYARDSREAGSSRFTLSSDDERGHIKIDTLRIGKQDLKWSYKENDETEMKVILPAPLKPGESIEFDLKFFIKIPSIFSRFGHTGDHYEFTQWYPKIVVYDKKGWHPDGYRRTGEFYGEFGTYDVEITVPTNMTVAATGELVSPESEIARLDSMARMGAKLDDLRERKNKKAIKNLLKPIKKASLSPGQKTLHFHAEKVHDFAWVADHRFILKRGKYKNVVINIFTLPENEHQGKEAIDYTFDTLEHYGKHYGPYPYNQVSVVDGGNSAGGGMEYPNLTIINFGSPSWLRFLELVIMHEVGHNWFYGMLGNNEMDEAWLDEGMNSFAENRYLEEKYGTAGNITNWPHYLSFMPQLSDRYLHSFLYYAFAVNHAEQPILTPAHQFKESYVLVYMKAAWTMDMLRYMLGDDKFDEVMQTYFDKFKFKHPTTEDFIRIAEQVSGRDLDKFFDDWLTTTKQCDLAIEKIKRRKTSAGTKELSVTIEQQAEINMPTDLLIENKSGSVIMSHWYGTGKDTTFKFSVADWPKSVWIDPNDRILEVNNWNNRSPRKFTFRPFFAMPSFNEYQVLFRPTIWYEDDVDGLRTGLLINGGQFRDFSSIKGFCQWSLYGSYAFGSEKFNYSFGFKHPISWLGNSARFVLKGIDIEGQKYGQVGLNWRWSPYLFRAPEWRFQLNYFYQDVYNRNYINEADWDIGITSGGSSALSYSSGHYRFPVSLSVSFIKASEGLKSDFDFSKISVEMKQSQKWTRRLTSRLRIFGGYIDGIPGQNNQFYLSGGLVPTGPLAFIVDRRGRYSPQNYFFVEGDGNMRGYYRRHFSGKVIGAANLEVKIPYVPLNIFYDVGNVWSDMDNAKLSDIKQDAGLELDFGILKFHFPFWVSHPLAGEKEFKYRWLLSIRTSGLNIGF